MLSFLLLQKYEKRHFNFSHNKQFYIKLSDTKISFLLPQKYEKKHFNFSHNKHFYIKLTDTKISNITVEYNRLLFYE